VEALAGVTDACTDVEIALVITEMVDAGVEDCQNRALQTISCTSKRHANETAEE